MRLCYHVALTILIGCFVGAEAYTPGDNPEAGAGPSPQKHYTIGMSQCNLNEPWRVQMDADIRAAAEKHSNLNVIFKDAQNDAVQQQTQVEDFISAGVDLIMISPKEAKPLTEPVAKAYRAGIPAIVLDRAVIGDQYTCFIVGDNKRVARAAGDWLVKQLGGKGNVVELKGSMTSTPGQDRHWAFRAAIKGTDIDVVYEADMKWLMENAQREMESALARLKDIDAVYAHNDPAAYGAYLAARAAGRQDEMLFVGIDALPKEGIAYVKQGILDATFQYPTGGAEAIDVALKIFRGEKVPKKIVLGTRVFTKDNVDQGGEALE